MRMMVYPRFRNNGNNNNGGRGSYRRYSRSRSRSRERGREQNYRHNRRNSSARSRDRGGYRMDINNDNQDYQDNNRNFKGNNSRGISNNPNNKYRSRGQDDDYMDDRHYNERVRNRERDRDRERDYDNRDTRHRDRGDNKRADGLGGNNNNHNNRRSNNDNNHSDRDEGDDNSLHYYSSTNQTQTPSNTIIVEGLQSHITEADIMSLLIQAEIPPTFIRVIRKRSTGAPRGFAFVEFNTTEEAAQWMEYTQGTLKLNESCHATLQYSLLKDWHCGKCGLFNLKRRENCFKCHGSRDDSQSTSMNNELKGKPKCFASIGDRNDGKVNPTPDVFLPQYNEASGYYYDPTTGLHYDAHSLYSVLATPATVAATVKAAVKQDSEAATSNSPEEETTKKEKKDSGDGANKHDKVKVAKKIVKDMEKWAKKLNQKKDYKPVAAPQSILALGRPEDLRPSTSVGGLGDISSGFADVGFSILEKNVTNKLATNYMSPMTLAAISKLIPSYGSDSEDEVPPPPKMIVGGSVPETIENDYVDFQNLTCLLCKRTFKFLEILHKHLKMSNLHKENLAKHNLARSAVKKDESTPQAVADQDTALAAALAYRDQKMGWSKTRIIKMMQSRYGTM